MPKHQHSRGPAARHRLDTHHAGARRALVQSVVVVLGLVAYSLARGLAEADRGHALGNARDVIELEKTLGIFWEPALQRAVLEQSLLLSALNSVYIWAHWPLLAGVLLWLLLRHHAAFLVLRNAVLISSAIALVVYALYPLAPPRLAGIGLLDTVTERSTAYRVFQPPGVANQYAAMPSLHMGWDVLVAIALVRHASRPWVRAAGLLLPPLMLAAILLTANHWILDAVAGVAVALLGLHLAQRIAARRPTTVVRSAPLRHHVRT